MGFYNILDTPDPDLVIILAIISSILAFFILCVALIYIFRSVALYRLAANRGMSAPGLAWIPIFGQFRIGGVADNISKASGSRSCFGPMILIGLLITNTGIVFANIITIPYLIEMVTNIYRFGDYYEPYFDTSLMANTVIGHISSLISLAVYVTMIVSLNKIYKCYRPMSSTSWTVLSVIFPFLQPFFLFAVRNSVPVPEWRPQPVYYPNPNQPQSWPPQGFQPQPPVPPPQDFQFQPPVPPPQGFQAQPPVPPPQGFQFQPPAQQQEQPQDFKPQSEDGSQDEENTNPPNGE